MRTEPGERRVHPRHPIRVPIRFQAPDGSGEIRAQIGDLSLGGLSFRSPCRLPEGSTLEVVFPLERERVRLEGAVARCEAEEGESSFRVGVRFQAPQERFRLKLTEQVLRIHELRRELSRLHDREVSVEEAAGEWVRHYAKEFADLYG